MKWKQFQVLKMHSNVITSKENHHDDINHKITKITSLIVLVYGVTWSPSIVYYLLIQFTPSVFSDSYYSSSTETYVTFFIKFITYFDGIATPIIYCYYHNDFKQELKNVLYKTNTIITNMDTNSDE